MQGDDFEWDDAKAALNVRKHGVGFPAAQAVFRDPFAIERLDDRGGHDEDRFVVIGMVENRLITVAYTMRGDRVRIITARGAEPNEQRRYHEENR